MNKLEILRNAKRKLRNYFSEKKRFNEPYYFLNNSKNNDTACFILAGYKEFTWDIVFKRIKMFCTDDIDICIVSSGLYNEKLCQIAKENKWSYISMKRNNVCLALNSAIRKFEHAKKIFKLDEDIFVTDGFFNVLPETYEKAKLNYFPCFAAPLLLINGFCYRSILEKLGLINDYTELFEYPRISAGPAMKIESDLEVSKYMWGENNKVPHIDKLNDMVKNDVSYQVCPIRFSIGAIYFERKTLEQFGYFPVSKGNDMGKDEEFLCNLATTYSKAIIVSNNNIVGHLSFGKQNKGMETYYMENKNRFDVLIKE